MMFGLEMLFSFLGGSAFRMIWGEVSGWLNKKLEHQQELERMRLSEEMSAKAHERQKDLIETQHSLGIQQIQVAGDVEADKLAAQAFIEAQKRFRPTGIKWVDGWNAAIRPGTATIALVLWVGDLVQKAFILADWDKQLVGAVLGFYFADRTLGKRGK